MVATGLLTRLEARSDEHDPLLSDVLSVAADTATDDPTTAWFSFRYGRDDYGTLAVFPDDATRRSHLHTGLGHIVEDHAESLLADAPAISRVDVIAEKLPESIDRPITKGLLLTFEGRAHKDEEMHRFLLDARPLVEREPGTLAWFALQLESGEYGIFDVFADNADRLRHLTGHVPRELAKEAFSLLGGVPEMHMLDVISASIAHHN